MLICLTKSKLHLHKSIYIIINRMDWNINDFIVKFPNMNNIIKCFYRPNTDDIIQKDYMGLLEILLLLLLFSVKSYYTIT